MVYYGRKPIVSAGVICHIQGGVKADRLYFTYSNCHPIRACLEGSLQNLCATRVLAAAAAAVANWVCGRKLVCHMYIAGAYAKLSSCHV